MDTKMAVTLSVLLTVLGLHSGWVGATPGSGFSAAQQWKVTVGALDIRTHDPDNHPRVTLKTKGTSDVYVTRNEIAIGGQSGWHTHPGPSFILVTLGEVAVYDGDDPTCTPTRYRAGEGFVDPGGGACTSRNEAPAPAETVASSSSRRARPGASTRPRLTAPSEPNGRIVPEHTPGPTCVPVRAP